MRDRVAADVEREMRRRSLVAASSLLVAARGLSAAGGDARFRTKLADVVGKRTSGFRIVIEDCSDVANAARRPARAVMLLIQ